MVSLLPNSSTELEKALEKALDKSIKVDYHHFHNPEKIPTQLLNLLALHRDVDFYDAGWSEKQKREVIKKSFLVHSKKGTIGSIKTSVIGLGIVATIQEWFDFDGSRATFKITLNDKDNELDIFDASTQNKLLNIIDDTKRFSQHFEIIFGKHSQTNLSIFGTTTTKKKIKSEMQPVQFSHSSHLSIFGASQTSLRL